MEFILSLSHSVTIVFESIIRAHFRIPKFGLLLTNEVDSSRQLS